MRGPRFGILVLLFSLDITLSSRSATGGISLFRACHVRQRHLLSCYVRCMADEITTTRTFRTTDDLWRKLQDKAAEQDVTVSQLLRDAVTEMTAGCDSCGECDVCGLDTITVDTFEQVEPSETTTIFGYGMFSETDSPEVQALIDRAKELLAEGAVGVSIATDMDPATAPSQEEIDALIDAEDWPGLDKLMEDADIRPRHVAIVDTPAFSGAYLGLAEDGTLAGPVVFEGLPTGDMRMLRVDSLKWDADLLPIPIIFDLTEGDHTGVTVGHIDRLERVTGVLDEPAVPIAASMSSYPAGLFTEPQPGPMSFETIDGFTRYYGMLAPTGVCHKGRQGCYTYKGADLGYFHSGAKVPLDDGTYVRVGRIVSGGVHTDSTVNASGHFLDYDEALARTDDARRTVAMGRCFDTPKGLLFSGVLLPDVDPLTVAGGAPSVELWPNKRGKLELKTALLVNQPAWPVAASVGAGIVLAEPVDEPAPEPELEPALAHLAARIDQLEATLAPMFAAHLAATLDDD